MLTLDLLGDTLGCGTDCPDFTAKWTDFWHAKTEEPVAMLQCGPDYMDRIGTKSRNMIRKANGLYDYRVFDYNENLTGIKAVNFSKSERQGHPMTGWYTRDPEPVKRHQELCRVHRDLWVGGFIKDDNVLAGYCHIEVLNDLAIINSILGKAMCPSVINGLFGFLNDTLGVRWINYLQMESASDGLTAFKKHVGFVELDLR